MTAQNNQSKLRIGIAGLGTVGAATLALIQNQQQLLQTRSNCQWQITRVVNRSAKSHLNLDSISFSHEVLSLATANDVDVVVELIGGSEMALKLVETALNNGKHVVTANKALLALHGNHLFQLAHKNNLHLLYEAAVAGTIPIIRTLRDGICANSISLVAGILNGTSNYILTAMEQQQWSFEQALAKAQELGYAEADPSADIDGSDAAHKLALMAALAFDMQVEFEGIYREGIDTVSIVDIAMAAELNYRIKHLGIANLLDDGTVSLRVHPILLPDDMQMISVDGTMNAIMVSGSHSGQTLYYGAGAGGNASASSVVADLVEIARGGQPFRAVNQQRRIVAIDELVAAFYLRFEMSDEADILNKLTAYFSDNGINLDAVIQHKSTSDKPAVVLLTDVVKESILNAVLDHLQSSNHVVGDIVKIRIASFDSA